MILCRVCGRQLTDGKSKTKGIGPRCEKKENVKQTDLFTPPLAGGIKEEDEKDKRQT